MNTGSIMDRLLRFCNALVGRFRGGLAQVNVVQSIIFASMSGSALADAAGAGKLMQSLMTRDGKYPPAYRRRADRRVGGHRPDHPAVDPAGALCAGLRRLGRLPVPRRASFPGLLIGAVQSGLIVARWPSVAISRVEERVPLRELPRITWQALPALMMPVILLGALYSGITTPTEAAARRGRLRAADLGRALPQRTAGRTSTTRSSRARARRSSIGMLIAGALVFNYVITVGEHPEDGERDPDGLRTVAVRVPADGQRPAAGPGLLARRHDDHPGDSPGAAPDRRGAGHRPRALRRDGGDEHHDRAGDAARTACCCS